MSTVGPTSVGTVRILVEDGGTEISIFEPDHTEAIAGGLGAAGHAGAPHRDGPRRSAAAEPAPVRPDGAGRR